MFFSSTEGVMSVSCKSSCKVVKHLKHNEKAIRFCAQSSGWKSTSSMWISEVNSKQFTATFNVGNKIQISSPSKTKLTFTIKTISNKRRIARTVEWALGIGARCIRMAFVHFNGMGLAAFVNVWKNVHGKKKKNCWRLGQIRSEKNIQSLQDSTSHFYKKNFLLFPFPFFINFCICHKSY